MAPPNNADFIRRSEFEREQDKNEDRFGRVTDTLNKLTDLVAVSVSRITTVEGYQSKQGDQAFSKGMSATQVAWGCLSGIALIVGSTFFSILSTLIVNWIIHH